MLKAIVGENLHLNLRTNTVVTVLKRDPQQVSVATVTEDGTGRSRSVRAAAFHENYLASDGQPHTSGYVPLGSLPKDHPYAPVAPKQNSRSNMDLDNLDALSDDELAALILEQERVKKDAAELAERAKAVAKYRRGGSLGLDVRGDIALVFSSGEKFDAKTAQRRLNPVDFQRILLPKPDATMARKLFENEPEKLAACMKDNGPSLTVRVATEDDLAKYKSSQPDNDEDYSYTV